jgi:hypothetical protein
MKSLRTKSTKSKNAKRPRTLPRIARAPKAVEKAVPVATPVVPEPPKPREVLPFVNFNQTVNPEAPLLLLVQTMLCDEYDQGLREPGAKLLAAALRASADEIALIQATDDGLDHAHEIERVLYRAENRARITIEIARRIQAGQVSP